VAIIIVAAENNTELRGIVTAFDLLKNELLFVLVGENDHISGTRLIVNVHYRSESIFQGMLEPIISNFLNICPGHVTSLEARA